MRGRLVVGSLAIILFAGCQSTPEASGPAPTTREAYLEWRAAKLLRVEPETRSFADAVDTPKGEWPGHLAGRTIAFKALWLAVEDNPKGQSADGRDVLVVRLGDPQRSDRDARLCLDAADYDGDRFRFDNLAVRSGEWRGTPVKVTAYMTGVPEDPALSPWIGRILAVKAE